MSSTSSSLPLPSLVLVAASLLLGHSSSSAPSLSASASPTAFSFWDGLADRAGLPALPAHTPAFSVATEYKQLTGASGVYTVPMSVVRDQAAGGVVVATYWERDSFLVQTNGSGMGELQLLAPTPALAPKEVCERK
jgi:hypothetical protein